MVERPEAEYKLGGGSKNRWSILADDNWCRNCCRELHIFSRVQGCPRKQCPVHRLVTLLSSTHKLCCLSPDAGLHPEMALAEGYKREGVAVTHPRKDYEL